MRSTRMGAGPERLLEAGIEAALAAAGHDVNTTFIELPPTFFPAEVAAAFEINRALAAAVSDALSRRAFPVVLAGNCNTALGTVTGAGDPAPGVIWFDAHADLNTPETSVSGFFDGTALAALTGRCWTRAASAITGFRPVPDARIILVGVRSIDCDEAPLLSASGIARVSAAGVRDGMTSTLASRFRDTDEIYLHVDLDVLDSSEGRANGYSEPGGLTAAELLGAVAQIGDAVRIRAAALTAFDPSADDGRVCAIALDLAVVIAEAARVRLR